MSSLLIPDRGMPTVPPAIAPPTPNTACYSALMFAACAAGVGLGCLVADRLGASTSTLILTAAAIGIGCLPTFIPALFGGRTRSGASNFGLCVLFASGARTLAILALALGFDQTRELSTRSSFWIGVMSGAGLVLVIESVAAIRVLARMEHLRQSQQSSKVATA